jgi:hypothetical protein
MSRPTHRSPMDSQVRRALLLVATSLAVAVGWGCGDALEPGGEFALSIDECEEIGGTPLFDPEDQRPLQLSCPQGLVYMGQFDEDFYGTEGGVCCGGPSPSDEAAQDRTAEP